MMENASFKNLDIDDIDRRILEILRKHGDIANKNLAQQVGIAPSTCSARVKALHDAGAIRGVYADVHPSLINRGLQAMIAVRLRPGSRMSMDEFGRLMAALPGVEDVFFVSGPDDFLINVCMRDTDELSSFVTRQLSNNPAISFTQTMLIFDHHWSVS